MDAPKGQRTLLIFDDCMLEKQEPIEKYFSQGRHGKADCFYLCQSYFKIPKCVIRENANPNSAISTGHAKFEAVT